MPAGALMQALSAPLERREQSGRQVGLTDDDVVNASSSVNFGSNDALSISTSVLRDELFRELDSYPDFAVGSGTSRVLEGDRDYVNALEAQVAQFHGAKDGLIFNSGYEANMAIWKYLPQAGDVIVYDDLAHASIHDGMRTSRAKARLPFKHNDMQSLRQVLYGLREDTEIALGIRSVFIVVESIYSMDGDLCPVDALVFTAEEALPAADRVLVVDEAHASGMVGPNGAGLVSYHGFEDSFTIRMHTFSKAIGCSGAIILCDPVIKRFFKQYARNYIYTTGPPFMVLASIKAAYRILDSEEGHRRRLILQSNVRHFRTLTQQLEDWKIAEQRGLVRIVDKPRLLPDFESPIMPVMTPPGRSRQLAAFLGLQGFFTPFVSYPVVPLEEERLRIVVQVDHSGSQLQGLVQAIAKWALDSDLATAKL